MMPLKYSIHYGGLSIEILMRPDFERGSPNQAEVIVFESLVHLFVCELSESIPKKPSKSFPSRNDPFHDKQHINPYQPNKRGAL